MNVKSSVFLANWMYTGEREIHILKLLHDLHLYTSASSEATNVSAYLTLDYDLRQFIFRTRNE